jgi:hypothetical protein
MDIYDEPEPQKVFGDLINNCSDTPASCKFAGLAGHAHSQHPCRWCHITLKEISTPNGFDREGKCT